MQRGGTKPLRGLGSRKQLVAPDKGKQRQGDLNEDSVCINAEARGGGWLWTAQTVTPQKGGAPRLDEGVAGGDTSEAPSLKKLQPWSWQPCQTSCQTSPLGLSSHWS